MSLSRRAFLCGASVLAIAVGNPALAFFHHLRPGFNGGKTQFNTTSLQNGGDFTFLNILKQSQGWGYNGTPSSPTAPNVPIIELDANGYVTGIVAGTIGVSTVFQMPGVSQYAGQWSLDWDGSGTIAPVNFSFTTNSSSANNITFTRNDDGGSPGISVTATSASPNNIRNIRLTKVGNDNTSYGYAFDDKTLLSMGYQFSPLHIALIKTAMPGVIRSLGWGGNFQGTNESPIGTWAQRRPVAYFSYSGFYQNPNYYGGQTSNSGSDYTLAFGGFSLSDKAQVTVNFNATAPQNDVHTLSYTTASGNPIVVNWTSHGLAVGNVVMLNSSAPAPLVQATQYFVIATGFGANSFEVAATPGGSAINASGNGSGSYNIISIPRININGTGFVPVTGLAIPIPNSVLLGFNTQYPVQGTCHLTYDAALGYFWLTGVNGFPFSAGGYISGCPPEVFIDYCAAIGAHPHLPAPFLTMEPVSDYMTSWVSYVKFNYSWMKPRVEPPNETWNSGAPFLGTRRATGLAYTLWGSSTSYSDTYGKWVSVLGQAISAIYGNDRTKYSMICAVQEAPFTSAPPTPGDSNDQRLKSNLYVTINGGSPAYLWADRVCTAPYFGATEANTNQELVDAYNYSIGSAGQQAAILNNYVATSTGSISAAVTAFVNLKIWAAAMPGGSTVVGSTSYEGGYSTADPLSGDWTSVITAASKAVNCVLTISTTSNPQVSGLSGTPAFTGMQLTLSGFTGGFATFNGTTVTVVSVAGNLVTTNLDTSAQASAFSGSAGVTYVNSGSQTNALRTASKQATGLGAQNTTMYNGVIGTGDVGFVSEYPSNFLYTTSDSNQWSVLGSIYSSLNSQWNSIVAYSA